jgi:peptide/nickel transport system permease protein
MSQKGEEMSAESVSVIASGEKKRFRVIEFLVRMVREKPLGTVGLVLVVCLFFTGIFSDMIAPYGMNEMIVADRLEPPSTKHLLGTDNIGRDLLSRIIYGARVSMIVGLGASSLAAFISTLLGLASGYIGGKFDIFVQRFVDAWICFPGLVIYLTLMSVFGAGLFQVIFVLGVGGGIGGSRLLRSTAIALKGNIYIQASNALGATTWRVVLKHLLPNVLPIIIIGFTLGMAGVILAEASLSFLGFGVPPPQPSWGGMLSGPGRSYMLQSPGMAFWPGLALTLAVYGINMFGDALRDLVDPRLKGGVGGMGSYGAEQAQKALKKRVAGFKKARN